MQAFASSSSPPPPSSPASPAPSLAASPPVALTASALPLAPFGSPLPAVPLFVQLPAVSPPALLECLRLSASASSDDSARRAGSVRLRELSALSGYGACLLLLALSAGQVDDSLRLLAAIELKNSIAALFSNANKSNSAASVHRTHTYTQAAHSSRTQRAAASES